MATSTNCYPEVCSALSKDGHVCIQGRPCKIVEMTTSKTGEETMVHLVAKDIFTGKEYEDTVPSSKIMDVPKIRTNDYLVMEIRDDGSTTLLETVTCDCREDKVLPQNDLFREIKEMRSTGVDTVVTLVYSMGEEHAVSVKKKEY